MRVLIVDDSLLAEHAIKSYFVKLGHEVVGLARDAEMGKEKYFETKPDLITVDAVMPGMHGTEFIKFINENDRSRGIRTKILMISSDDIPREKRMGLTVDKYLLKPITLAKISETLSDMSMD